MDIAVTKTTDKTTSLVHILGSRILSCLPRNRPIYYRDSVIQGSESYIWKTGSALTIEAKNNSATNKYIRSIKLNGKNHTLNYFKHNVLVEGGKIQFLMDNEPNLKRGSTKEAAPYSFSLANE